MNPALAVLALASVAGWWATRRWLGFAVLLGGLAGCLLLLPALRLRDGVPSPAAILGAVPPWQGELDPEAGNPLLVDVASQIDPWLLYLRREWRAGRLPGWNPHQLSGAPFWGNGQSAPLFPLHLLFVAAPLQVGLVLLPWLRVVVGAAGAWALARRLGCGPPGASLAAVVFPLAGMPVSFLLFPMGNALALVPWVLWALEGLARGTAGWPPLALAAGAQLLAGHPETAIHTALLGTLYLLVRGGGRRAWGGWVAGWLAGGAIAAVQLVPLLFDVLASSKWAAAGGAVTRPPLLELLAQPLRLVLPQLYGHPAQATWWGPFNYSATAVFVGALALPLAAVGAFQPRDRRRAAVVAVTVFSFLVAYHLPGLWDGLVALPLLGRIAHHRLLFGLDLGLALLAGWGLDGWLAGRRRALAVAVAASAALVATAWLAFGGQWHQRGLAAEQVGWTAWTLAAGVLLLLLGRLAEARRRTLVPALVGAAMVELLVAHGRINPGLPLARLYPETGAVAFLRGRPERVAGLGWALRPNAAMVYGLYDVRGDDPVRPAAYETVYGGLATPDPVYFRPIRDWASPWLDRLGVRWVLAGPDDAAPAGDWQLAYAGSDARVYRRPTALPLVRWRGRAGTVEVLRREPGRWRVRWRAAAPGRVVIAENAARGWAARFEGAAGRLGREEDLLLAVDLPPGAGVVDLRYRPPGLLPAVALSLVALAISIASLTRRSPRA